MRLLLLEKDGDGHLDRSASVAAAGYAAKPNFPAAGAYGDWTSAGITRMIT
jgi:hypothetical protein